MHQFVVDQLATFSNLALIGVLVVTIIGLGKGADWLVDEAVSISIRSGIPSVIVGATIVSLGTTAPEAFVSVLAAVQGKPELALGNAVGSIICDTGLILGLACVLAPLPFDRRIVSRQGWIQFGCGILLVAVCVPWNNPNQIMKIGGMLHQSVGWGFMVLLAVYLVWSIRQTASVSDDAAGDASSAKSEVSGPLASSILKLVVAIAIVVVSADVLIAAVELIAQRLKIDRAIIAATLVAFGTSLPELVTAMTAVRKNQGELAVGNIIGADILNVLFVAGAAASVTPLGLNAAPFFFKLQFPAMILVLLIFRIGIFQARDNKLGRPLGVVLLLVYAVYLVLNFSMIGAKG